MLANRFSTFVFVRDSWLCMDRRSKVERRRLKDARFGAAESVVAQQILAAACVPMAAGEKRLGALYVDWRDPKRYAQMSRDAAGDVEYLTAFANQAALAIENARLGESLRTEAVRRARLRRFVSPRVADRILQGGQEAELGGQRMEATILYARIPSFHAMVEQLPSNQLVPLLNEYLNAMMEIIFQANGTIHRITAATLAATFGTPVAYEGREAACAATALRLQQMNQQLCEYWLKKGLAPFRIAIGAHQGDVIAGMIGSEKRLKFEILGDGVEIAQGVSELAPAGKIFASKAIAGQVGRQFETVPVGSHVLQGRTARTEVFEIRPR